MKSSFGRIKIFCLVACPLLAVLLLTACNTAEPIYPEASGTNAALKTAVSAGGQALADQVLSSDRLVPGNKITVTFSGTPNPPPKHEEKIREDGHISPPLLGKPVMAAGRTVGQLQEELQGLYVPAYFRSLTVTVTTEERVVYVGGEVKNPGPHPYLPGMTVLKAIQAAGDFTEYGNRRNVVLTRANGVQETVNCSKALKDPKYDKLVFPDDRIHVRKRVVW
jgi:protein involved in polysaccharide export with SLBB domain